MIPRSTYDDVDGAREGGSDDDNDKGSTRQGADDSSDGRDSVLVHSLQSSQPMGRETGAREKKNRGRESEREAK